MNDKRKYLFWLIPAALVLLAVLFFLYPRRVDVIPARPAVRHLRGPHHPYFRGRPRRGKRRSLSPAPAGYGGAARHLPASEHHL